MAKKVAESALWHKWYAWYPVRINHHELVWLGAVVRKKVYPEWHSPYYEYQEH